MDAEYLAELRANAAEVRADLEEREGNTRHGALFTDDPEAMHDAVMEAIRPNVAHVLHIPDIVHKTMEDARRAPSNNGNDIPPFTDDQMEILADTLAQIRMDIRMELEDAIDRAVNPLLQRISNLEGQLSMLTDLLGSSSRTFEASETVRRLNVR